MEELSVDTGAKSDVCKVTKSIFNKSNNLVYCVCCKRKKWGLTF